MARSNRAIVAARRHPEDQDLYIDSAALSLHDFYSGLERIFHHIAASVDNSVPSGYEWHRELLRQMAISLPQLRPHVLSQESIQSLDEYLAFRHVVRNIYAFQFNPERIERLIVELPHVFSIVSSDLKAFADFLEQLSKQTEPKAN
ncbi:MAG: hypothetical protein PH343_06750 [Nitrospira sp.]|nr:hypothetical protein [Nitrospira sp.]